MPNTPNLELPYPAPTDPADVPHDIQALATRLDAAIPITAAAWTAAPLQAPWTSFGAPYETAAYLKDAGGVVHLKGVITGGSSNTTAFVLPAGFRPGASGIYAVSAAVTNDLTGLLIATSGVVQVNLLTAGGAPCLSGLTFLAEH